MNLRRNLSTVATIVIILIAGIGGYYFINLNKGPYAASDLKSISYQWGVGDTLTNSYHSVTGEYQYLDRRDAVIKSKIKLRTNDLIFIHSKANEAGLWTLPSVIANPGANLKSKTVLRYEIVFNYAQRTKKIIYMTDYLQDQSIVAAFSKIQNAIEQVIKERE